MEESVETLQMKLDSSRSSIINDENLGNTIPNSKSVNPCKHWCFTLNNYDSVPLGQDFIVTSNVQDYIYGYEVAKSGTKHIQGFVTFKKKSRPSTEYPDWWNHAHWEKMKGRIADNIKYCSKEGNFIFSKKYEPAKELYIIKELRPWQQELENILRQPAGDRKILWYWDSGNTGKTVFCKYICKTMYAMMCGGKAADAMCGLVKFIEKNNGNHPDVIIYNLTRNMKMDYTGLEAIKDGIFFSPKYESSMCIYNSPHVVVFANSGPDMEKLTSDRWIVTEIKL